MNCRQVIRRIRKKTFPDPVLASDEFFSHIGQDRWVAEVLKFKKAGYFLDFGAFDGQKISNTLYLERALGWTGICVEPNPIYYTKLCAARSCICVNVALWPESRQSMEFIDAHGLSCFPHLIDGDSNADQRHNVANSIIHVDTLNPTELLNRFKAPKYIEYLSLDVEGAEMDVLKAIDLEKYKIALMTIEHSMIESRKVELVEYLGARGYEFLDHSYDGFFFNRSYLEKIAKDAYADHLLPSRPHTGIRTE